MPEKRTVPRKKVNMYMRVLNDDTQEIIGHIVEISQTGLRLETVGPVRAGLDFYMRIEITPDLGSTPYIVFIARSKWCRMDEFQPNLFQVGFELVEIIPEDRQVYLRIIQKYAGR